MNANDKKVYIQNFWYVNNYGACLTAYALYTIIKNLDYQVELINISNVGEYLAYQFRNFIEKYCKTTKRIKTFSELEQIIDKNAIYITGSDQVLRPFLIKDKLSKFLFDYVGEAKKIAFSASFGKNKEEFVKETSKEILDKMKRSLESFDIVSAREKNGIEICKDIFGIEAIEIIDPVFILDKSYYYQLTENLKKRSDEYIASCIFEKKDNKSDEFLSKKYNCKVVELHNSNFSIEDWLNTILNCKFLVTNSYHAMCFAIIFNKPFIALSKDMGAGSRFESLFELLGIQNQSINSVDEIYQKDCIFKLDYDSVNKEIAKQREFGFEFLHEALEYQAGHFEEKQLVRTEYLEETICRLEAQSNLKYQIKKELWYLWLIIFHKFLPEGIKNIIRNLKGKNAHRK